MRRGRVLRATVLKNTGIWRAAPILISGASAYRADEYLYQDYLYDDHGAGAVARQPNDQSYNSEAFARPEGTEGA